jgi:paraquat-inducible protein A
MAAVETVACPGCDLLQTLPALPQRAKARCPRCGEILASHPADPLDRPLALTLAAAIVFIVANTAPLMALSTLGREVSTTVLGGAHEMWLHGEEITALVVAFCAVIAPAAYIVFMLAVLLAVRRPRIPWLAGELLRWADLVRPWAMDEVMMLGILVALVKMSDLATVIPGIGMYAVGVLVVLLCEIMVTVDPREVWSRAEWAESSPLRRVPGTASSAAPAR